MIRSISIILPLYNEAQRLSKTFYEIKKFSEKKTIKNVELIFVDDGSKDNKFTIACSKNAIQILELKKEGKPKMSVTEFLKGNKIKTGQNLM